ETGAQDHVYHETQGMIAWLEEDVLVVKGSMQCPYYVLNALQHALGRDDRHVRVVQAPTGGGFGGKEEYPSTIALHAALLALKSGRPVKLVYDRVEDMAATTKRHPARVRHRTGLTKDGKLLAQDIEVVMDGGAYVTLSPVVLSRGIIHAAGPYACEHVRIDGRAMFRNAVPFGAFRGFGAAQTHFAGERHMDVVAHGLGRLPDGRVEVLSANIEMGQGAITVFTALAAARLGLAPDDVVVAEADTARVPNSGPTVASRTSMVVGRLVERACDDLLKRVKSGGR